jgi:hypothetical protein
MLSRPRNAVLCALALSLVVGYFVIGHYLYKAPIGLDSSAFLLGDWIQSLVPSAQHAIAGPIWAIAALLAVMAVSVWLVRRAVAGRVDPERRSFLTGAGSSAGIAIGSLVFGAGAGAARAFLGVGTGTKGWAPVGTQINDRAVPFTHPEWKDAWKGSRVQGYRRFGRTGWNVSDIVLGTGRIGGEDGEQIARLAIERGVNYFDTAPDYSGAGSEMAMGKAIRSVPRDRLFIASKFCTPIGHLPPGTPVPKYVEAVEGSLRRLGTDYIDLCHIHSCDEVARLLDPNVHEAFDRLKQAGKVRFLGFSTHTPNLVEVATTAIDSNRFDVMMLGLSPWDLAAGARAGAARTPGARHGRRGDEDAQGRQAPRPARLPALCRQLQPGRAQVGARERRRVVCGDLVLPAPARRRVPAASGQRLTPDGPSRSSPSTTARSRAATAVRTAAPASPRARRACRSTTCCATACTSRTTAGRRKGCSAMRRSPRTRACARAARRRARGRAWWGWTSSRA